MSHKWDASYFLNFGTTADMCDPLTLWLSIWDWKSSFSFLIQSGINYDFVAEILWNLIFGKFFLMLNLLPCTLKTKDLIKCLKNVDTFLDNDSKMKVWELLTILFCGYKFIDRGF